MLKKKNKYIIIFFIVVLLILGLVYLVIDYKGKGIISGIVLKEGQEISEELDFHQTYYNASVEIYLIEDEVGEKQELNKMEFVKELKTDKEGKFSSIVRPGKYMIKAYYSDDLKSDKQFIEVKFGKVSWLKIYLKNI